MQILTISGLVKYWCWRSAQHFTSWVLTSHICSWSALYKYSALQLPILVWNLFSPTNDRENTSSVFCRAWHFLKSPDSFFLKIFFARLEISSKNANYSMSWIFRRGQEFKVLEDILCQTWNILEEGASLRRSTALIWGGRGGVTAAQMSCDSPWNNRMYSYSVT